MLIKVSDERNGGNSYISICKNNFNLSLSSLKKLIYSKLQNTYSLTAQNLFAINIYDDEIYCYETYSYRPVLTYKLKPVGYGEFFNAKKKHQNIFDYIVDAAAAEIRNEEDIRIFAELDHMAMGR